jgi:hypothetical protein
MVDEERSGAPPVPPEQEPGEPDETKVDDDPGAAAKEAEAEAEEARVDAAPREVP